MMDLESSNNQHMILNSMEDRAFDELFQPKPSFQEEGLCFSSSYNTHSGTTPKDPPHHHHHYQQQQLMNSSTNFIIPYEHNHMNNAMLMNMGQPPDMVMGQKLQPPSAPMISSSSSSSITVSSTPQIISFGNPSITSDHDHTFYYAYNSKKIFDSPPDTDDPAGYNWSSSNTSPTRKNSQQAQCHVEAERKRREKLSALFVSLTKVVPGLRKLDKISVLEDAIKHMIELQERLKVLEEEIKKNTKIILDVDVDDDEEDHDDHPMAEEFKGINIPTDHHQQKEESMHDIKVKMSGENVLIKILCHKRYYGCLLNLSNALHKLHLTLLDTRVLLFGGCALDITFVAQMESHFSSTVSGIIKHLQNAMFQSRK
ncbi:OLC1v1018486C1 [Oldenlandia corymbosa var. corymbosa]|nr:OLC1v1018486C1 [Oldenlandia corymbosa var. corymbosa]